MEAESITRRTKILVGLRMLKLECFDVVCTTPSSVLVSVFEFKEVGLIET